MKVTFKQDVYVDSSIHRDLGEVIEEIRTGKHRELIDYIRTTGDKSKKTHLPAFMVGVRLEEGAKKLDSSVNPTSTGMIQFDIDEHDETKSSGIIDKLKSHPSVIYAFLSPRLGVKFGVQTDFDCSDKSCLNRKHGYGYKIVRDEFLDFLGDSVEFDDSTKGISLQCLMSYDPNAYFNPNPQRFELNNSINTIYQEEEIRLESKALDTSTFNTTDDDVLEALSYIPDYLKYADRRNINWSVISHFGNRSKQILLSHWVGVKNKKKLNSDIDTQIKSYDGKIKLGTLYHHAKKNGYTPSQKVSGGELTPTFHSDRYFSKEESSRRLDEIILDDFFLQQKDKVVLVEAGSGKTRTMFKTLSDFLLGHPNVKVAIFLRTHEMMEQFVEAMDENIRVYNKTLREREGLRKSFEHGIPLRHFPSTVTGRINHCLIYDKENDEDKKTLSMGGESLCQACFHRVEESCSYFDQFETGLGALTHVRVYTHNRLFPIRPKWDKKFKKQGDESPDEIWKPDYVIIDEDVIGFMTEGKDTRFPVQESDTQYPSIKSILHEIDGGGEFPEVTFNKTDTLTSDLDEIEFELKQLNYELSQVDKTRLSDPTVRTSYDSLQKEQKIKSFQKSLVTELLFLSQKAKRQSKYLWLQHDKENHQPPTLVYGKPKQLLEEYRKAPMLYLDASGEEVVINTVLDREFEFEHLRVQQQENAKSYQFNNATFSKRSFTEDPEGKKIDSLYDWIDTLETSKLGFIRYKKINGNETHFQKLDDKVDQINGGEDRRGHFGKIRGLNKWEDCDTLIVLGQHRLPTYEIFSLTQLIFRQDVVDDETEMKSDWYSDYIKKEKIEKVYRMKNGVNHSTQQYEYKTDLCALVSNHFDKAETYQAVHRLRLIHGVDHKSVFIFSDTVIDVSVDELLDRYRELKPENIGVIKHLKENRFILDTTKVFSETFGWTQSKSEGFRRSDSKGSGSWLKSHRSLKYWNYETKNRRVGRVYSWFNQAEKDVVAWLESTQGLDIKRIESV